MASSSSTQGSVTTRANPDRIVPMRVIVCGVHRTGTLSMFPSDSSAHLVFQTNPVKYTLQLNS